MCLGIGEVYHVQLDAVSTCLVCKGEGKVDRDFEDEDEDQTDDNFMDDQFIEFDENNHTLTDED